MKESGLRCFSLLLRVVWIKGGGALLRQAPTSSSYWLLPFIPLQPRRFTAYPTGSADAGAERWQQVFTLQMPWLKFFLQKKDKKNIHIYICKYICRPHRDMVFSEGLTILGKK